jgi:hypothetical protein
MTDERTTDEPGREPPALLVEQLALGELDADTAARVRDELDRAGGADEALARIDASNREILADYPPARLAADIRRRAELEVGREVGREAERAPRRSLVPRTAWILAPTLAAAALVAWIIVRDDGQTRVAERAEIVDDGDPERTRIKGAVDPHIVIDRQTSGGHERLGPGDFVGEGDLLQLSYVAAGHRHGVIVSIDGAGVVTLHHPGTAEAPALLEDGAEVPLSHSYELDDAPGFERFVFVTRDGQPPAVAEVMGAAEQLAEDPARARAEPLELPGAGWSQHSLLLRKRPASAEGEPVAPTPAGEGGP